MEIVKAKAKEMLSNQERIEYYERALLCSENQLHHLSQEIGYINQELALHIDKARKLKEENNALQKALQSKEKLIQQETDSKALMITRLNNKSEEAEKLKSKLNKYPNNPPLFSDIELDDDSKSFATKDSAYRDCLE